MQLDVRLFDRFPVNGLGVGQIVSPRIISAYGAVVYSSDSQKSGGLESL